MLKIEAGGRDPLRAVVTWLYSHFNYVPDSDDGARTVEELTANMDAHNGAIYGGSEHYANAACFLLQDLGVAAEVVWCTDEHGAAIAVCRSGDKVLDVRHRGRLTGWNSPEYHREPPEEAPLLRRRRPR